MTDSTPHRTLQINFPLGQTLILALAILALIIGSLEWALRRPAVMDHLAPPSLGSDRVELEVKLFYLDQHVREQGINCVFIGSSVVWRGLNPQVFAAAYQAASGEPLHCFNLGMNTLSASGAADLAAYIQAEYHPRLIVYGLTPRAISADVLDWSLTHDWLDDFAWWRYQHGSFSLEGWAYSHLRSYSYYQTYGETISTFWQSRPSNQVRLRQRHYDDAVNQAGWMSGAGVITLPLPASERNRLLRAYGGFALSEDDVAALDSLLARNDPSETQVVMVEIPIHPIVVSDFLGETRYGQFTDVLRQRANAHGASYWLTTEDGLIPDDGWLNANHLNSTGAAIFSQWLGEQVGALASVSQVAAPETR